MVEKEFTPLQTVERAPRIEWKGSRVQLIAVLGVDQKSFLVLGLLRGPVASDLPYCVTQGKNHGDLDFMGKSSAQLSGWDCRTRF